jgi:DNA-binding response OmpR family regulator
VLTSPLNVPGRTVRVLLVDDDTELGELVREYLAREGFVLEVEADGTRAVDRATSSDYQLIVLDVMLPGVSGFDILRHLRAVSRVPVLMLTARGDDVDRIVGLELGADDYLSKPFNPRELVARIRPSCAGRSTTPPPILSSTRTSAWTSTTSRSTCGATSYGARAPWWS